MRRFLLLFPLAAIPLAVAPLAGQQPDSNAPTQAARPLNLLPALKPPVADTGIFSPLALPQPNEIRRADGAPGPGYWQQRADYVIKATLDTTARRIDATERIRSGSSGCRSTRTCSGPAARVRCCSRPEAGSAGPASRAASTS